MHRRIRIRLFFFEQVKIGGGRRVDRQVDSLSQMKYLLDFGWGLQMAEPDFFNSACIAACSYGL